MAATLIDTHRIVGRLKGAGFNEAQAEAVTDLLREERKAHLAHVATQDDLASLATKADLAALESRIIKGLVPLLLGQAALIVTLLKLFG